MVDVNALINTGVAVLPAILAMFRREHEAKHPGVPPLTDADVFVGLQNAVAQSVAKDDALAADIRRRNPEVDHP